MHRAYYDALARGNSNLTRRTLLEMVMIDDPVDARLQPARSDF
jgi:hypothetical protein